MSEPFSSVIYVSYQLSGRHCVRIISKDLARNFPEKYSGLSKLIVCRFDDFRHKVQEAHKSDAGLCLVVLDYIHDKDGKRATEALLNDLHAVSQEVHKPLPKIAIHSVDGKEKVAQFIQHAKQQTPIKAIENWSDALPFFPVIAHRILNVQKESLPKQSPTP
ncbi:MAG: hypothetical protein WC612_03980 [Bdellovibrionales bacterium]|jgi:hypothetical protein